jgi:hypothetical protein
MHGDVFDVSFTGQHGGLSHPYCVVLELAGGQAIVIPGFSPDKPAVEKLERVYFKLGVFAYPFKVRVDHARLSNVRTRKTLHEADYIMPDAVVVELGKIAVARNYWGTLPGEVVRGLAVALLEFNKQRPTLDPDVIKELQAFLTKP